MKIKEGKTDKYKRFRNNTALQNEIALYAADMEQTDYLFPSRKGVTSRLPGCRLIEF
ncbi:hypothetical protein JOC86_001531 [Bacillus pakistanensis]|uniref:Uncharacterized protein n=1 Tax=Rossellomorea pakistanensis TaxID=992288 RepID=A0ABS2NB04_9BACI|nr:hypothetical protein [Bacillus pakistanensis]